MCVWAVLALCVRDASRRTIDAKQLPRLFFFSPSFLKPGGCSPAVDASVGLVSPSPSPPDAPDR